MSESVMIPIDVLMNGMMYDQIANAYYKNPDGSVDIVIIGIDSEGKSHTLGVVKPEDMEESDDIPSSNL